METKVICDDGSIFVVRTGADAELGNGISIRDGAPSIPFPPECSTPEFWERMDAIRELRYLSIDHGRLFPKLFRRRQG